MEISRHWRLQEQRYNLVGENCPHCSGKIFPPRDICPECKGLTVERNKQPVAGKILFAGEPDREGKIVIMARMDNGKTGFGDIISGAESGELTTGRRVVWRPAMFKKFAPAGNEFELLAIAQIGAK